MKAEHYRLIYESKREHSADALSKGLPDEFRSLLSYRTCAARIENVIDII